MIDSWFGRLPLHIAAGVNTIIKIAVGKDATVLSIPWSTKIAFVCDLERAVGFLDGTVVDVDAVFVPKCGVCALPRSDASTTASKGNGRLCHPARSKAVEEVSLSCYFTVIHVCVSQFANVDLRSH